MTRASFAHSRRGSSHWSRLDDSPVVDYLQMGTPRRKFHNAVPGDGWCLDQIWWLYSIGRCSRYDSRLNRESRFSEDVTVYLFFLESVSFDKFYSSLRLTTMVSLYSVTFERRRMSSVDLSTRSIQVTPESDGRSAKNNGSEFPCRVRVTCDLFAQVTLLNRVYLPHLSHSSVPEPVQCPESELFFRV
jgi:hypothetical protein